MKILPTVFIGLLLLGACSKNEKVIKEPWINKPVSQWPDIALTNEICFSDTVYANLANAFLINTGTDTLAASCKHLFMVFESNPGLNTISLDSSFKSWRIYPKNNKNASTKIELINENEKEQIDRFNTLKVRDWLIFNVENKKAAYPIKIRHTPVAVNEVIYTLGWGVEQKDKLKPELIKLHCFKNVGNYFYTKPLTTNANFKGKSGSPVFDKNGYLVGIASGQEGNLGVMCGVKYLLHTFDQYKLSYVK